MVKDAVKLAELEGLIGHAIAAERRLLNGTFYFSWKAFKLITLCIYS